MLYVKRPMRVIITKIVQLGLRYGVVLFILSEVLFFVIPKILIHNVLFLDRFCNKKFPVLVKILKFFVDGNEVAPDISQNSSTLLSSGTRRPTWRRNLEPALAPHLTS